MTIEKASANDAGKYTAEAVNEVGKVSTSGSIEVDVIPEIVKGLVDGEVEVDDEQRFKVEVSTPVRTVKW